MKKIFFLLICFLTIFNNLFAQSNIKEARLCPFDSTVISFSVSTSVNGVAIDMPTIGRCLHYSMITVIEMAKNGTRIYFENFMVKGSNGIAHKMPKKAITIIKSDSTMQTLFNELSKK